MNWKAALRRLSNQVSAHEPPLADRVRRKELARGRVLQAFLHALDVLTVPDALDREAGSVLAAYCDPLLVEGRIPPVGSHPVAQFAAWLLRPGAVLPMPFPVPLLEALCDPRTVRVGEMGCRRCLVSLPESTGRRRLIWTTPCPVCGSENLGPLQLQEPRFRLFDRDRLRHRHVEIDLESPIRLAFAAEPEGPVR